MSIRSGRGQFEYTDVTGRRFDRLLVESLARRKGSKYVWRCKCDCGNTACVDISNLNNGSTQSCGCLKLENLRSQTGPKHPNWKGGRVTSHHSGYVFIHKPDHPHSSKAGYVSEHRLVMEQKIGRLLFDDETVHHKNGLKQDNRPENLELRVGRHGKGQSVEDMVLWAKEILKRYGE